MSRARALSALLATALFCGIVQAQPANPPISDKELVIATKEAPPFVMKQTDGTLHGISIDLWQRIADRLHLTVSAAIAASNEPFAVPATKAWAVG